MVSPSCCEVQTERPVAGSQSHSRQLAIVDVTSLKRIHPFGLLGFKQPLCLLKRKFNNRPGLDAVVDMLAGRIVDVAGAVPVIDAST